MLFYLDEEETKSQLNNKPEIKPEPEPEPEPEFQCIYGVDTNLNPILDNIGLEVEASSVTYKGRDDYANIDIFKTRECATIKGTKNLIYKDDYEDDAWQQIRENPEYIVWIEFPKSYVDISNNEVKLANYRKEGFIPDPLHYRNNHHYNYAYISKYIVGSDMNFASGTAIYSSGETLPYMVDAITGLGYYPIDYFALNYLWQLYEVMFRNRDYQSVIGYGNLSVPSSMLSGTSDTILGRHGAASQELSDVFMGVEGFCNICTYYGMFTKTNGNYHEVYLLNDINGEWVPNSEDDFNNSSWIKILETWPQTERSNNSYPAWIVDMKAFSEIGIKIISSVEIWTDDSIVPENSKYKDATTSYRLGYANEFGCIESSSAAWNKCRAGIYSVSAVRGMSGTTFSALLVQKTGNHSTRAMWFRD